MWISDVQLWESNVSYSNHQICGAMVDTRVPHMICCLPCWDASCHCSLTIFPRGLHSQAILIPYSLLYLLINLLGTEDILYLGVLFLSPSPWKPPDGSEPVSPTLALSQAPCLTPAALKSPEMKPMHSEWLWFNMCQKIRADLTEGHLQESGKVSGPGGGEVCMAKFMFVWWDHKVPIYLVNYHAICLWRLLS